MLNLIKGNIEKIGKIIQNQKRLDWGVHLAILQKDIPKLQNNLNLVLDWINDNEKLKAVEEIRISISKIQANLEEKKNKCISKFRSHIYEYDLKVKEYLEQFKTLEECLEKTNSDKNDLRTKFKQLKRIYDKIENDLSLIPFEYSVVNDNEFSKIIYDHKEKIITRYQNLLTI